MKKIIIILSVIILILLAERFIFNTSDMKVIVEPDHLYASQNSEALISVTPVNRLGFRNPLGSVNVIFVIDQGKPLAEITSYTQSSARIRAKEMEGEIQVSVYSAKSGLLIKTIVIKIFGRGLTFAGESIQL